MSDLCVHDLVVAPGQGEATASDMVLIFRTERLGGHFSIMEGEVEPKALLAPHTHANEDQTMFILNGELEFEIGGEGGLRFRAGAGAHVIKPRGVQHCFWNLGDATVRYVECSTEDGFERFIDSRKDGVSAMVGTANDALGITIHADRIPGLMRAHGLTSLAGLNVPPLKELVKDPAFRESLKDPETRRWVAEMVGVKVSQLLAL
ncbi:MAG: cupin domain-containing protein [Alphaproteobacteria bacterium]|nr:cupin domain-containing protein [Alphaproteobacteria bacterium]